MALTTNAQASASVAIRSLVAPPGTVCSFLTGWAYRNLLSPRSPNSGLYELHDALDLVFSGWPTRFSGRSHYLSVVSPSLRADLLEPAQGERLGSRSMRSSLNAPTRLPEQPRRRAPPYSLARSQAHVRYFASGARRTS